MALTSSSTCIFTHLIIIITVSTIGETRTAENGNSWRMVQKPSLRRIRANERASFFDLELQEVLGRSYQNRNLILSPISIKVLLGALMEGAGGETRNEISHAVRLYDDPVTTRTAVRSWVSLFKSNSTQTELKLATHMFLSLNNEINEEYGKILRKHYMGDVSNINVAIPAESATKVNDWVSEVTNGFIPTLVNEAQINVETKAVLASAVYFKSKWSQPFAGTSNNCFYKTPGECTDTVFMQKEDQLNYAYDSSLEADIIQIPYEDKRYSMVIFVPKGRVQELERDLQHGYLTDILSKLTPTEIHLQLPRFTADSDLDIIPALQKLQINELFGPSANLSGIFSDKSGGLSISNILHSAKIVVDETGTEAAGATAAQFVPLIGKQSTLFIVNKPFVFLIRDSDTNVILFSGQIFDPEKAMRPDLDNFEVGDKSSDFNYINPSENVDPVQSSDRDHKPPRLPGRPDRLPPRNGLPSGFLTVRPEQASIKFSEEPSNLEGFINKNNVQQNTFSKASLPPQFFSTTMAPPLKANPTRPLPLSVSATSPNARPTALPPPIARITSPPPLIIPRTTRRPVLQLSRRTTAPPQQLELAQLIPNTSPPRKGSSNIPSSFRSFQFSYEKTHLSITHFDVSDPPKIRRSPDERIVFTA